MLTSDDIKLFSAVAHGGYHLFTKTYFDWEPLKYQYALFYAPQPNVTFIAGIGAGKTTAVAMSCLTKALTTPYYRALNTSISSYQANLMFEFIRGLVENNPKVNRFIAEIRVKPYPKITTIFDSFISFMTVGFKAQNIRGSEWDEINFDEGGFERSEETLIALRGRLRGTREDGTPRTARMLVTTTPTDVQWLRRRWERGNPNSNMEEYDGASYASIRATMFDNIHIPDWQRDEIIKDMPQEMIQQEIMAEFPDWGDSEFSEVHVNSCENTELNALMEHYLETNNKDISYVEVPRLGCIRWEMPFEPGRSYIVAADPGTGNPPKRNAGVVMVFDVTNKPYRLVFFHWTSGNGSYTPWLTTYKYAINKYNPILNGMDTTGSQKAIDELVLEREGIHVDSVSFANDKAGMLNTLKMLIQNHEIEFPFIKGLRSQLRAYHNDDKNLAQDIVSAMMVFAYCSRHITPPRQPITTLQTASRTSRRGQVIRRRRR